MAAMQRSSPRHVKIKSTSVLLRVPVTDPDMQMDYYRYRIEGSAKIEQYDLGWRHFAH